MKTVDKYTVLSLDDYNGVYSIIQGYEKDGEFRKSWVTEEFGKSREPKKMPKNIRIGDKAKAIEVAVWLYQSLTGKNIEDAPF
jgi:hypothetical protein